MTRVTLVLLAAALLATGACTAAGSAPPAGATTSRPAAGDGAAPTGCAAGRQPTTVAYGSLPGVPANATSLDVWAPPDACDAPVVVWVHGGGYHHGDKANAMHDKRALFNGHGWILVSVNYRLTRAGDPTSAHHPDHYEDVAAALAWVEDHLGDYGGDAGHLALLGHSAGADIVANVAVDPRYLADQGASADLIDCLAPLDTAGFDKTRASRVERRQWADALGNHRGYLRDTSATRVLRAGDGASPPDTLSVYRGSVLRQSIERDYLRAVRDRGATVVAVDARSLTHGEVNRHIGAAGDDVMTPPLVRFLGDCFAG